jgi:hypothetical protein
MARLKSLTYPGETILLHEERSLGEITARVAASFAAAAALFKVSYHGTELFGRWLDNLGGTIGLVAGLVAIVLLAMYWPVIFALPFGRLLSVLRPDHWRVAVTDQRVLLRRGLLGRGHDEMMRLDIETCLYDRAEGKILLTGTGRELAIACNQRQAGRILAALGYDEAGA